MSSLHALQLLTTAARLAQQEHEFIPKAEITKKLEDIKYLSSQKKVPRLSLRKEIIHLENQLQGILGLEERFARQKDKESITVASLKQQIMALKNKLRTVEDLELDKKVEHLSFLLGEHLAKREVASEVAMTKAAITQAPVEAPASEEKGEVAEYGTDEKHQASLDVAKKAAMLQRRLDALKREAEIHRELETKNPQEMLLIEEKIKLFEDKLQQYYEQHPEAMLQEMASVEVPADFEVKHKMLFPQTEKKEEGMSEEVKEAEKMLPLPPPPRMKKRG